MFQTVKNDKWRNRVIRILLPLLLVLYSYLMINQGLTVTDTGYNYGNYVNFESLDGMWKFSTFLASSLGAFFTRLPFGNTMLGLNFYTCSIKTATVLMTYYFCVRHFKMNRQLVFLAELMTLGYCWCPTALIYNYCTYLLFTLGGILLCLAVRENRRVLFIAAGVLLGVNVMVRLPNLAEMTLIIALWLFGIMKRDSFSDIFKRTMYCVLGYLMGIAVVMIYIICRYGFCAYMTGIKELFAMPGEAGGYSLTEMLLGSLSLYIQNTRWLLMALLLVIAGMVLYTIKGKSYLWLKRLIYIVANVALIFVFRRLYMFDFGYYYYNSIYAVGILFLIITGVMGLYIIFFGGQNLELRMQAMVVGIIVLVTPLGSNNYLYSAINNLFFVAPFVFHVCFLLVTKVPSEVRRRPSLSMEPLKITLVSMVALALVQGIMFGAVFVFRDGIHGEKRTEQIENNSVLRGMYTNEANAKVLQGLNDYLEMENLKGARAILYKDIPSLAFYMELEPALSTTWPDLASFSRTKFEKEITGLKGQIGVDGEKPIIILGKEPNQGEAEEADPKLDVLKLYMDEFDYRLAYWNEAFLVYR